MSDISLRFLGVAKTQYTDFSSCVDDLSPSSCKNSTRAYGNECTSSSGTCSSDIMLSPLVEISPVYNRRKSSESSIYPRSSTLLPLGHSTSRSRSNRLDVSFLGLEKTTTLSLGGDISPGSFGASTATPSGGGYMTPSPKVSFIEPQCLSSVSTLACDLSPRKTPRPSSQKPQWDTVEESTPIVEKTGVSLNTLCLSLPPRGSELDFYDYGYDHVDVLSADGSTGSAHLVRSVTDGKIWVAKTIDISEFAAEDVEEAMLEAELLNKLRHPNIVEYKDSFVCEGHIVIIMEYCRGGDLFSKIASNQTSSSSLSESEILCILTDISLGLEYMHSQGVIHCDLKTANVFLTEDGTAKLGDLGVARVLMGKSFVSPARCPHTTPMYMSPEICTGGPLTEMADMWALGCILYEMCTLRHAFMGTSPSRTFECISNGIPEMYLPQYSQRLSQILQNLLIVEHERRSCVKKVLSILSTPEDRTRNILMSPKMQLCQA